MPYHFEFDPEHRVLLVILEGDVEDSEMQRINNDIRARVSELNPSAGISDFSRVTTFNVTAHVMRMAALQPSPYPEETPRYIVAPRDELFGMARMYELIANRPLDKLKVVRSRKDALAALGVKNPRFERLASK
jgi:hypothetical protein